MMAINAESTYWPRCSPSQDVKGSASGYVFGFYCIQEWVDGLNEVLTYLGYCGDGLTIRKFLAQIAYETGYYSTLGQPLDSGSGLIHMIPQNFQPNAEDMDAVFPGEGLLDDYNRATDKQALFKDPKYAWKSAAAWYLRTNGVIPGCGMDLFPQSYAMQTRCILGHVVDRSEAYSLVSKHIPCTGTCGPGTGSPPPTSSGGPLRCGSSWGDGNGRCGTPCPGGVDSECPSGERCYADLDAC